MYFCLYTMSNSSLISILTFKCPKCHKGSLFVDPNPFHFKNVTKMPDKCPCCGQRTELEPGFYYGAMYASYGLSMMLFLFNFFFLYIFLHVPSVWFLVLNTVLLLVLWPIIFRLARVIYIHLFVKFDPFAIENFKK
ncbi:MAG TPA: DUF983 domain-containing protein [Cytophagaceae bacterium]|jgi:hypothetical protein|nr:DUF983 domain-containing protein [Cytophagaceae bacterium]